MNSRTTTMEDVRLFLVAAWMVQLSLTLLLASNGDATTMGFGVMAFQDRLPTKTTARSAIGTAQIPLSTRIGKRRRNGWLSSTPTVNEDLNATYIPVDIPQDFVDENTNNVLESCPMQLIRNGKQLELSPRSNDRPPIVLLDDLPTETWTAVQPATQSSELPLSFSSLVLQTQVPSEAIQSLTLGKFLVDSSDKQTAVSQQQQYKHKFLAASRLNRYWMGPKFGNNGQDTKLNEIPVDTQYLLVQVELDESDEDSSPYYALMMPLVDGGYRSSLEASSSTIGADFENQDTSHRMTLMSYSESGENLSIHDTTATRNALYVAIHDDPYELLQIAFREVSNVLNGSFKTLDEKSIPSDFVNSFGWCSWDAFYSKVHPSGILEGVQKLSDAGIPVKNVILDDGWQQVSPPYLHQQEEAEDNQKKNSVAASLSLSGSSDIMPPPDSKEDLTSSTASTEIDETLDNSSPLSTIVSSVQSLIRHPLETLSKIGESIFNTVAGGISKAYQKYVENAPVGSLPSRIWTLLARYTPLNAGLWAFFDSETDFGRQLNDFPPNWKFLEEDDRSSSSSQKNMALKELVGTLKKDWNVNKVYCWHSIHGYWRGVSDELGNAIGVEVTQVRTRPSDQILRIEPEMAYDPPSLFGVGLIGNKKDLVKFYQHLHEPLVAAGIDGVKVDVQSGVTAAGFQEQPFPNCPQLAKEYTESMEESVALRFPSDPNDSNAESVECINCMCHSTENLYRYKSTAVARASDDFYPARPESHTVHLVNVAYNSMFLGEICLPDWDMFHSQHASAELHAAARAIGGCPVYVSDKPGNHNIPLLQKLVLPDGSVLRAKKAGRPTRDCIFADVGKDGISALKIWNTNRESSSLAKANGGVLGAFNVQGVAWDFERNENQVLNESPAPVIARVRPHDVENLRTIQGPFAVWSHRTKSLEVLSSGSLSIETKLDPREWEIFTIQPVQELKSIQWAPIGLGDMLNSGGAILDVGRLNEEKSEEDISPSNRIQADITARGPGRLVSFCQPRPSAVILRDGLAPKELEFSHNLESGLLELDLPEETIEGKAHLVSVIWES